MMGQSIAHYRVTAKLGAGGMGECIAPPTRNWGATVAPDGQRFLMTKGSSAASGAGRYTVVLNWTEELKRLAPARQEIGLKIKLEGVMQS